MNQLQKTARSLRRFRLRTRTLKYGAVIFGLIAVALLIVAFAQVNMLSASNYITGFSVQEIDDDGETLLLSGGDDESLTISRAQYGSDLYFKVKKAVREGGYIRAFILRDEAVEIQYDGGRIYKDEDVRVELGEFRMLIMATVLCLLVCAAFVLSISVRKTRRRARKNKK